MKRCLAATLVALLPLQPIAGAALCLHRLAASEQCAMSVQEEAPTGTRVAEATDAPPDCGLVAVCGGPSPTDVAPPTLFDTTAPHHDPLTPAIAGLHAADPATPPTPPPNGRFPRTRAA